MDQTGPVPTTRWAANDFFRSVNAVAEQYGTALLIWDEIAQAVPMMQNAIAGALLDRRIGESVLHPRVFQIATGNRATDKAGSNRILTQVGNRWERLELEVSLDDWVLWALGADIDPLQIAYHRFKGGAALFDFDPSREINATPRSWAAANRVPTDLPDLLYRAKVAGRVGEGYAIEYCEFRNIYTRLPSRETIRLDPTNAPVPEDASARFAAIWQLMKSCNEKVLDRDLAYVTRYPREYQVAWISDLTRIKPELKSTKPFINWAVTHGADALL